MNKKVKDTLFIDMKYIILYRKLGYKEIAQDVFEYCYNDEKIIIESENQLFKFKGDSYHLLSYHDFVILECIDRLLKKGYHANSIILNKDCDIEIHNDNKIIKIYAYGWDDYDETLINNFHSLSNDVLCVYTSQLSGGIVDFKCQIKVNNEIYDEGIFEIGIKPFDFKYAKKDKNVYIKDDFKIQGSELIKYMGKQETVIIPDGITRIGTGAFWNNTWINKVVLPESVNTICGDTFIYCTNLKSINIPSNVSVMGDDPFAGCFDLVINNHSKNFILDNGVLFDKEIKTLIHYSAFKKEERYVVPKTITWIGKHSFYKCNNLKEVVISENVAFMGNNSFSDCSQIHLVNKSKYFKYEDGVLYNASGSQCMHYSMGSGVSVVKLLPTVRTIGRNCFWNCKMIEKIIIPESVRQIGYNPFASCSNIIFENNSPFYEVIDGILYDSTIKELVCCPSSAVKNGTINIPKTVTNLGRNCFAGCDKLKSIIIPDNVKFVSRSTFSNCTSLKKAVFPDTIKEIVAWCFNGCVNLEEVRVSKDTKIVDTAFFGCPNVKVVKY